MQISHFALLSKTPSGAEGQSRPCTVVGFTYFRYKKSSFSTLIWRYLKSNAKYLIESKWAKTTTVRADKSFVFRKGSLLPRHVCFMCLHIWFFLAKDCANAMMRDASQDLMIKLTNFSHNHMPSFLLIFIFFMAFWPLYIKGSTMLRNSKVGK